MCTNTSAFRTRFTTRSVSTGKNGPRTSLSRDSRQVEGPDASGPSFLSQQSVGDAAINVDGLNELPGFDVLVRLVRHTLGAGAANHHGNAESRAEECGVGPVRNAPHDWFLAPDLPNRLNGRGYQLFFRCRFYR